MDNPTQEYGAYTPACQYRHPTGELCGAAKNDNSAHGCGAHEFTDVSDSTSGSYRHRERANAVAPANAGISRVVAPTQERKEIVCSVKVCLECGSLRGNPHGLNCKHFRCGCGLTHAPTQDEEINYGHQVNLAEVSLINPPRNFELSDEVKLLSTLRLGGPVEREAAEIITALSAEVAELRATVGRMIELDKGRRAKLSAVKSLNTWPVIVEGTGHKMRAIDSVQLFAILKGENNGP